MLHLCVCSANLTTINKAILYVKNNEQTHNVCIIHATDREEHLPPKLRENVRLLDSIYPKLRIDLVVVRRVAPPSTVGCASASQHMISGVCRVWPQTHQVAGERAWHPYEHGTVLAFD